MALADGPAEVAVADRTSADDAFTDGGAGDAIADACVQGGDCGASDGPALSPDADPGDVVACGPCQDRANADTSCSLQDAASSCAWQCQCATSCAAWRGGSTFASTTLRNHWAAIVRNHQEAC